MGIFNAAFIEREKFMRHIPLRRGIFRNTHPCPGGENRVITNAIVLFLQRSHQLIKAIHCRLEILDNIRSQHIGIR